MGHLHILRKTYFFNCPVIILFLLFHIDNFFFIEKNCHISPINATYSATVDWETNLLYMDDVYWNKDEAWSFMSGKTTDEQ
jgi:hypothetical protein